MSDFIKIDGFQHIEKIVDGSYWTLYRAERLSSGTRHLLQVLDKTMANDARLVTLFKELRGMSSILHHDNILTPIDFDDTDQTTLLIYEDFNGVSLRSQVESDALHLDDATSTIRHMAEALQFAQIRGVRHGWVLPEVVLRSPVDDSIRMIGFGSEQIFAHLYDKKPDIAELLNPFIPPENLTQAEQPTPDDCYALGVTFYAALTGQLPFAGKKVVDLVKQKSAPIEPDDLAQKAGSSMATLVSALLDPKPFRRATYSSLLNEFSPLDESVEESNQLPHEPETPLSMLRSRVSDMNPFNTTNVTGPTKIAYTSAIVVVALVLLFSIFVVARLVSNDKKRMQDIYQEYLAEQRYERQNETSLYELNDTDPVQENNPDENESERNNEPLVTLDSADNSDQRATAAERAVANPALQVEQTKTDLVVYVSAKSENVTAEIFVDGARYGYSNTEGQITIADLLVNKTYRIRVVRDGFQRWEKSVYIKDGENALDVKLQPDVEQHPSFTFAAVAFADQIKINNENVARNLPCTLELAPGKINVTYIDSKAEFSWRTSFDLEKNEPTLSVSADQVGTGDVVVVLNDPIEYGYAFVKVDEHEQQHTTPYRASLNAGWHRFQIFRDDYTISPADTTVFIRPGVKINIRCNVL